MSVAFSKYPSDQKNSLFKKKEEEQYFLQRLTVQMMAILTPPHPSAWETRAQVAYWVTENLPVGQPEV